MSAVCLIYHFPCPDGVYAAHLALQVYPNALLFPATWGKALPQLPPPEEVAHVFLLDWCGPAGFLADVAARYAKVTLIDHHKTAIEESERVLAKDNFTPVIDVNRCGAQIACDYFFRLHTPILDYIADHDLFRHALPDSKQFAAGCRAVKFGEADPRTLNNFSLEHILNAGSDQLVLEERWMEEALSTLCFILIGEHKYATCITDHFEITSELGNRLAAEHTWACIARPNGAGAISLSLRSIGAENDTTVDAKLLGGGGHCNASGCRLPNMEAFERMKKK